MNDILLQVERLKNLMTGAATDVSIQDEQEIEYATIRKGFFNQSFRKLLPRFIITCGTLKEFRREMQEQSAEYKGRRSFIKDAFAPLINSFLEEESMIEAVADIVQQVDYGHVNLLPQDIKDKGREMADVYLYLYCIENSIRIFITEIMKTATLDMPYKVQATVDQMKANEKESKYLPVRGDNDLFYCDFIQLGKIMISNWKIFGAYFPERNEHWLNVMIDELYKIRCLVAHNSYVGEHERRSLKVYYRNITLQLKF